MNSFLLIHISLRTKLSCTFYIGTHLFQMLMYKNVEKCLVTVWCLLSQTNYLKSRLGIADYEHINQKYFCSRSIIKKSFWFPADYQVRHLFISSDGLRKPMPKTYIISRQIHFLFFNSCMKIFILPLFTVMFYFLSLYIIKHITINICWNLWRIFLKIRQHLLLF